MGIKNERQKTSKQTSERPQPTGRSAGDAGKFKGGEEREGQGFQTTELTLKVVHKQKFCKTPV